MIEIQASWDPNTREYRAETATFKGMPEICANSRAAFERAIAAAKPLRDLGEGTNVRILYPNGDFKVINPSILGIV